MHGLVQVRSSVRWGGEHFRDHGVKIIIFVILSTVGIMDKDSDGCCLAEWKMLSHSVHLGQSIQASRSISMMLAHFLFFVSKKYFGISMKISLEAIGQAARIVWPGVKWCCYHYTFWVRKTHWAEGAVYILHSLVKFICCVLFSQVVTEWTKWILKHL